MTPNAWQTLRMPARLVASPTDMSAAFPYGGTALGSSRDVKITWGFNAGIIVDEGFMDPYLGAVVGSHGIIVSCRLRALDPDAVRRVFLNTKLGTWNDRKIYEAPKSTDAGYTRPGGKMEDKNFALLIAPEDETRHPFFILYNAMPILAADADAEFSRAAEFGIKVGFHGCCDTESTARRFDWGRRGSITL